MRPLQSLKNWEFQISNVNLHLYVHKKFIFLHVPFGFLKQEDVASVLFETANIRGSSKEEDEETDIRSS